VIKVDLQADKGEAIEVYLNGSGYPLRQRLVLNQRVTYVFHGAPSNISVLRLDPTDADGAHVTLYGLEVADGQGTLRRFTASDLMRWTPANVAAPELREGTFKFISATDDPILVTRVDVQSSQAYPSWWEKWLRIQSSQESLPSFIAVGFALFALTGFSARGRFLEFPLAALAICALVAAARFTVDHYRHLAPASTSVGHATFYGLSTGANRLAIMAAFTVAAGLGAIGGVIMRFTRRLARSTSLTDENLLAKRASFPRWARLLSCAIVVTIIGAILFPNLRGTASMLQTRLFSPQWDANNITYWSYLAERGYLPFRDFWYPYGGFYIFSVATPTDVILRWLYGWLLFAIFFISFYELSSRRIAPSIFATLFMLSGYLGLLSHVDRYLLCINVVISYLAIGYKSKWLSPGRFLFWLSCALALFFEPTQLIYGGAGIFATLVSGLWRVNSGQWDDWRSRLLKDFAVPAGFVLVLCCWLALHAQLAPFLRFQLNLIDMSTYSALPANLVVRLSEPLSAGFLALTVPIVMVTLGVLERLQGFDKNRCYADGLLALGVTGFMLLQKYIVREMNADMLTFCVASLLAYLFLRQGHRTLWEYLAVSTISGMLVFLVIQTGIAVYMARSVREYPHRIEDTWRMLRRERSVFAAANAAQYAPGRFALLPDHLEANAWLRANREDRGEEIFSLTDDPVLYILSGESPVYQANLYNASPIYEQQRMVRWLKSENPEFLSLDASNVSFDALPLAVRCPLIFEYVIGRYVPAHVVGSIEILRRRRPEEVIPLPYWRDKLGSTHDLGHLPEVSSFGRFSPCPSRGKSECVDFLEVHLTGQGEGTQNLVIPMEVEGLPFAIRMQTKPSQGIYYILLDRIWFWKIAREYSGEAKIVTDKLPPGVEVRIVSKQDRSDVLY
jgi:hypothetical protein